MENDPFAKLNQRKQQIVEEKAITAEEQKKKDELEKTERETRRQGLFDNRKVLEEEKDTLQKRHKEVKDLMEDKMLLLRESKSKIKDTPELEAEFRSPEGFREYTGEQRIEWDALVSENASLPEKIQVVENKIKEIETEIQNFEEEEKQRFYNTPEGKIEKEKGQKEILLGFLKEHIKKLNSDLRYDEKKIDNQNFFSEEVISYAKENNIASEDLHRLIKEICVENVDGYLSKDKLKTIGIDFNGKMTEGTPSYEIDINKTDGEIKNFLSLPERYNNIENDVRRYEEDYQNFNETVLKIFADNKTLNAVRLEYGLGKDEIAYLFYNPQKLREDRMKVYSSENLEKENKLETTATPESIKLYTENAKVRMDEYTNFFKSLAEQNLEHKDLYKNFIDGLKKFDDSFDSYHAISQSGEKGTRLVRNRISDNTIKFIKGQNDIQNASKILEEKITQFESKRNAIIKQLDTILMSNLEKSS